MEQLQTTANALELQFQSILDSKENNRKTGRANERELKGMTQYLDSIAMRDKLRKENRQLRRLIDEIYMKTQGRLRVLWDSNYKVQFTLVFYLDICDKAFD